MIGPSSEVLSLSISEANADGRHVIRWVEQMPWGAYTHLITTCDASGLDREREAFALFAALPLEIRATAAVAVRRSPLPATEVLAAFEQAPAATQEQPSLF